MSSITLNIFLIDSAVNPFSTQSSNSSPIREDSDQNDNDNMLTPETSGFEWFLIPTLSTKYFSPNGDYQKDKVIYSFSINQDSNYSLNISAYYEPLKGFTGDVGLSDMGGAAYLMPNGTWLVVGMDYSECWIVLGIGTNSTNLQWSDVGTFRSIDEIAIAGDETGKIRIVYYEKSDTAQTRGIKYYASNDWAKTWSNGTIADYTGYSTGWDGAKAQGISISAHNNTFTCVWGFLNKSNSDNKNYSKLIESHQNLTHVDWTTPHNLTGPGGSIDPDWGFQFPQVFYNRLSGEENGTLFLCYDSMWDPGNWPSDKRKESIMLKFKDGKLDGTNDGSWSLRTRDHNNDCPLLEATLDYSNNVFYFIDNTASSNNVQGIFNATWQDGNLDDNDIDYFQTLSSGGFNIYGDNGPKLFSGSVRNEEGFMGPGILVSDQPFNVITTNGTAKAYETEVYIFDGKDEYDVLNDGNAFSFTILTEESDPIVAIVYVDDSRAEVDISNSSNIISPFESLGTNDKFTINSTSSETGSMLFKLLSENPTSGTYNLTNDLISCSEFTICGDGLDFFLFFSNLEDPVDKLMFTKSEDGGLTWKNPRIIDNIIDNDFGVKDSIYKDGELYLWTHKGLFLTSYDKGETFIKSTYYEEGSIVTKITSNGLCWTGSNSGTTMFNFSVSNDFGFTWEPFCSIPILNADKFVFVDVAFNKIFNKYSFLIANTSDALVILSNEDGSFAQVSSDIIDDLTPFFMCELHDQLRIDVRYTVNGMVLPIPQWIITTSARYDYDDATYSGPIAYKNSSNGINYSDWDNFTDINGKKLHGFNGMGTSGWDIFFPLESEALFVTGLKGDGLFANSISITASTNVIYHKSTVLDRDYFAEIEFFGLTSFGAIINDGNYSWICKVEDRAGYNKLKIGNLIIDNTLPVLNDYQNFTDPEDPLPINETTITISINETNPALGMLYYRITDGNWQRKLMTMNISGGSLVIFNATIPSQSSDVAEVFWKADITDSAGNNLTVDNNGLTYSYEKGVILNVKQSGKLSPTLYDDWTWSYIFTSGVDHLALVWVRKIYDGTTQIDVPIEGTGDLSEVFSINISHATNYSEAIYKFMYKNDMGNMTVLEEIALSTPVIRIEEESEPPETIDLMEIDELTVRFVIPDYSEYIDRVYITYEFDDGNGTHEDDLESEGSVYSYTFDVFPEEATLLKYEVVAVDIYGNKIKLGKDCEVKILPKLPAFEISTELQLFVSILALIVGICVGIGFLVITKRKEPKREYYQKIMDEYKEKTPIDTEISKKSSEKDGISEEDGLTKVVPPKKKKYQKIIDKIKENISTEDKIARLIQITEIGCVGCIATALIFLFLLDNSVFAMLFFTGAFLLTVMLWIYLTTRSVETLFRSTKIKTMLNDQLKLTLVAILIYAMLFLIFLTGNNIAWWRVRVAQQSYNLGGIIVPKALTTVTTTFFSSIFLLTLSTFKEVSNKTEELRKAEELNDNPLDIIERREKAISSVISNVGKKGIIFIAIIGIVIVFASDLNVYATQGILIGMPFAVGAITTLVIGLQISKKKTKTVEGEAIVLDHIIKCPHCKEETALGGNYCEHCGKELLAGQRYGEGVECNKCNKLNDMGAQHCRYCGNVIEANKKQTKKSKKQIIEPKSKQINKPKKQSIETKSSQIKKSKKQTIEPKSKQTIEPKSKQTQKPKKQTQKPKKQTKKP